jgi:hypothetical protein
MKKGGAKIPLKFGQSFTDDRFRHLKPTRRFANRSGFSNRNEGGDTVDL